MCGLLADNNKPTLHIVLENKQNELDMQQKPHV